jgi:hypothetical protein
MLLESLVGSLLTLGSHIPKEGSIGCKLTQCVVYVAGMPCWFSFDTPAWLGSHIPWKNKSRIYWMQTDTWSSARVSKYTCELD